MSVRKLEPRDLTAFRALWLDGLRRVPEAFLLTEEEALATPNDALVAAIQTGSHWGVFKDNHLIGLGVLRRGGPQRLRHTGDLGPFYVHPDHQGCGVADDLLGAMLRAAREAALWQVELCVDVTNTRAIAFYTRHGFRRFGLRPRSVILDGCPRDDALMMVQFDATPSA